MTTNGIDAPWTPERTDTLERLWNEGLSAAQIAVQLKHVTRNAVIGKVHRLRLPLRVTPTRSLARYPSRRRPMACDRVPRAPKLKAKALPPESPPPQAPLEVCILDIGPQQCRAVTDASEWGRAKMCGHPCAPNSVYCAGHDAMFYTLHDRKAKAL